MVTDPLGSNLPFVYQCSECGGRFGSAEPVRPPRDGGAPLCPQCGARLQQQHRL
jgi:DNA-directed RNA polymerase subunit RPC12/RpoP